MADNQHIPPQAIEIEQAVLGAMMLDPGAIDRASATLDPDCFFHVPHKWIYAAIIDLHERGVAIDQLTLSEELKLRDQFHEAGGSVYLARLAIEFASAANIDAHARIILDKALRRKVIETAGDIIEQAREGSRELDVLLESAAQGLDRIRQNQIVDGLEPLASQIGDAVKQIEQSCSRVGSLSGIGTGFIDLDDITSGIQKGDLILLAAAPGAGKTSLALALARNAAVETGIGVAIFSPRTSRMELARRLLSAEAQVDLHKLCSGRLRDDQLVHLRSAAERLAGIPVYIDDTPRISITEIRAKARRLHREHGIGLIFVNSLEMMGGQMKDQQEIARGLKGLAQELNVPVLALSALECTQERPRLEDLWESGSLDQEADMVMFIYHPDMHAIEDHEATSFEGIAEIIIAKQRNGPLASVKLHWNAESATFRMLAPEWRTETEEEF